MAPPKSYAETVRGIRGPRDSGVAFDVNICRIKAVGYRAEALHRQYRMYFEWRHHGAAKVIRGDRSGHTETLWRKR